MGRRVGRWMRPFAVVAVGLLAAGCGGAAAAPASQGTTTQPTEAPTPTATHDVHAAKGDPLRAGERFTTLTVPRSYAPAPPSGGTDEYRCFLVDPGLTRAAYLTGSRFLPSNPDIVHHGVFYRVSPEQVAEAEAMDARTPGDGWTCFGGTGIEDRSPASRLDGGADWVAAWAPGGGEGVAPKGTGYALRPGSQLVMQVHYNLLGARGKAAIDRPGIRLRLLDGTAKVVPLTTTLLPAPVELPCAAGETGPLCDRETAVLDVMHRFGYAAGSTVAGLSLLCSPGGQPVPGDVQRCDHRVRNVGTVYALSGHMHLLGSSIKVELNPGTPRARTLLDIRTYNFHDQRSIPLPQPVTVQPGDTYRVTCDHDASRRKFLGELKDVPPRYVVWGDGTTDEMCLGIVIGSGA